MIDLELTLKTLTENEMRAYRTLVKSCFEGMGGHKPSDLANDMYTWVSTRDLDITGEWSFAEARGTFSSLIKKELIVDEGEDNLFALNICEDGAVELDRLLGY